jgi:hypothetical protein
MPGRTNENIRNSILYVYYLEYGIIAAIYSAHLQYSFSIAMK